MVNKSWNEKDGKSLMEQFQFDAETLEWETGRCEKMRFPKSFSA